MRPAARRGRRRWARVGALALGSALLGGCGGLLGGAPDRVPDLDDDAGLERLVSHAAEELPRWFGGDACVDAGGKSATAYLSGGWTAHGSVSRPSGGEGAALRLALGLNRADQPAGLHLVWTEGYGVTFDRAGRDPRRFGPPSEIEARVAELARRLWRGGCG